MPDPDSKPVSTDSDPRAAETGRLHEPDTVRLTSAAASPASVIEPPSYVTESQREIETGTVLRNRYLIERPVGSGGTSTVFSALDRHRLHGPTSDSKVAVKILHRQFRDDPLRVERLIREFRYMQRLTHPGIARVFDLDCDDGLPHLCDAALAFQRPRARHPAQRARQVSGVSRSRHGSDQESRRSVCRA